MRKDWEDRIVRVGHGLVMFVAALTLPFFLVVYLWDQWKQK